MKELFVVGEKIMNTTDERIQMALLDLMKEKRLEEITIIAIADKSKVNRTTVYRHYVDKYAILQVIENDIIQNFTEITDNNVSAVLNAVNKQRNIISVLLGEHGDPRFNDRFISFLIARGLRTLDSSTRFDALDIRQKELLIQYLSAALVGLVKYWLNHPDMKVEELDTFFGNLFRNGINSFMEP